MADGFRLADAFVEVNLRDRTQPGILKIKRNVEGIDDRTVHIDVDVDKAGKKLTSFLSTSTKGMLALGSAANGAGAVAGLAGSIAAASGALLLLPAAAAVGGAAFAGMSMATTGFSDALTGSEKKQKEAYAAMGAGARDLVDTLKGLGPAFNGLRREVQDTTVKGFSDDVKALSKTYLPILGENLTAIGVQYNAMGRSAAKALLAPSAVSNVNEVFNGTIGMLKGMRESTGDVIDGFLGLAGVGASKLPGLGYQIGLATKQFREWVDAGVESGRINELIDTGMRTMAQFGRILGNVGDIASTVFKGLSSGQGDFLGGLEKTTAEVGRFLKSVEGQEALKALGDTLKVVGDVTRDVLLTALREFGPVVTDAAPAVQAFARGLGTFLVDAIKIVGPMLRDMAQFLSENADEVENLAPLIGTLVLGIKGLQILTSVKGWVGGAMAALKLLGGTPAVGALGSAGGITWGKGFIGGLGLAGVGVGATLLLDDLIPKDAGKSYGAGFAREMLGEMATVFKGQGSPMDVQEVARWISNPLMMGIDAARKALQALFASNDRPEIKFDVNTGPARTQVVDFMNSLKGHVGTVDINGRTVDASQALADIIQTINSGGGDVTINGETMPASAALDLVVAQINEQGGTVEINGDRVPAGDALRMFLTAANASVGVVTITGNVDPATGKTNAAIQYANGSTGTVTLDGNPRLVNGKTVQAVQFADGSRGTVTIDGNPDPATGKADATVTYANGKTGRIKVDAHTGAANDAIDWAARNRTSTITVRYTDPSTGLTRTQNPNLPGSFGRAMGGPIGRASGGPVTGPGTGTSDSILAYSGRQPYALSDGEHVVTAAEVQQAGGQQGIYAIREAIREGAFKPSGGAPPKPGREVGDVHVHIEQTSGSPAETGRFVALALRTVG